MIGVLSGFLIGFVFSFISLKLSIKKSGYGQMKVCRQTCPYYTKVQSVGDGEAVGDDE